MRAVRLLFQGVVSSCCLLALAAPAGDENWDDSFGTVGLNGHIGSVFAIGKSLYATGPFTSVGGQSISEIAKWDGTNWSSLGFGDGGFPDAYVRAVALFENHIVVGGSFSNAGGVFATNVAQWDGTNWMSLGAGRSGGVEALTDLGTNLISGGGGSPSRRLTQWDGTIWQEIGIITNHTRCTHGCPEDGAVFALATKGHELYVGGRFVYVAGVFATNIARWDGTNWHSLGLGLSGQVRHIAVSGNDVFVAADVAGRIVRWDGSAWHDVGGGVNDGLGVQALVANGTDVYAAGVFRAIGGISANRIAKWDGQRWSALGRGIESEGAPAGVGALACNGSELYVGGLFNMAGGKASTNIALWHIPHALNLERSGEALRLSWPATGSNFVLETCPSLSLSNWAAVPPAPVVSGRDLVVTNEVGGSTRYYRLRRR